MDSSIKITQTLSVVVSNLTRVDIKVAVLLKKAQETKQGLQKLHSELQGLKQSLRSLSACLQNPLFINSTLTTVEAKNETLLQYITTVLSSSIRTLKEIEGYVKNSSKSNGGKLSFLHSKKVKPGDTSLKSEAEPTDFGEQVRFLALGLEIGVEIINVQIITHITKPHLRDVRQHIQALSDATKNLQTIRDSLISKSATQDSASTTLDYNDICLRATEFTTIVTKQADTDVTKEHSGFEPMSPLVEVLSNNTLLPSVTAASVIDLKK